MKQDNERSWLIISKPVKIKKIAIIKLQSFATPLWYFLPSKQRSPKGLEVGTLQKTQRLKCSMFTQWLSKANESESRFLTQDLYYLHKQFIHSSRLTDSICLIIGISCINTVVKQRLPGTI